MKDVPEHFHRATVSRRQVLRGLGASMILPALPSLAWAQDKRTSAAYGVTEPPRRWATMVFANGVNPYEYKVEQTANGITLGPSMKALEKHKNNLLFIDNMHLFDDTVGVHTPYFTNFLSGEVIRKGDIPQVAETIDNYLGRTIGKNTPISNLVLGGEGAGKNVLNATLTWSSKTTPVLPEVFPRQAFDRLFDVSGLIRDKSVLDYVKDQAKDVSRRLGTHDRAKLEEYMTAIRDIEQRIALATAEDRFTDWRPSIKEPNIARPAAGIPKDKEEHLKLMLDIVVLAFQMDQTRIATMLFENDITGQSFGFLNGVSNTGHHGISHHRKNPEMLRQYTEINKFHFGLLSYVMDKMGGIVEGEDGSTLLDNTVILFGSTMRDGDPHDANDLPLMIAGGKNCDISHGRYLRPESLEERRLCNLHLALAQRIGGTRVNGDPLTQFGNSHFPMKGLS
ncbi:MAG: DUF1552 domain-containing protein [Opitutales bacterium]